MCAAHRDLPCTCFKTLSRGVVWYNHLKLRDIRERVAAQHAGGGGAGKEKAGEDEERQPLVDVVVTNRCGLRRSPALPRRARRLARGWMTWRPAAAASCRCCPRHCTRCCFPVARACVCP